MHRNLLRTLRIGVALAVLIAFVATFADFRNLLPAGFARGLASTQFGPSLVALILGAGLSAGVFLAVGFALVAGRVYCSALCPLGILQDVVIRVSGLFRRKGWFLRHARAHNAWRHGFLAATVVAALAGWGGLALTLLDPYSNFGRIASGVFRPLILIANNAVAGAANALGLPGIYRVEVPWAGAEALILIGAFLTLVIVMSVLRGRLYCNTVCPVGTLLGFISRWAMFRLRIDQSNCRKCGQCLRRCKAQCIDLRAGTVDASRCVACYDCLSVCADHGIGYAFAWRRTPIPPSPQPPAPPRVPANPRRRAFLASVVTAATAAALSGPALGARGGAHRRGGEEHRRPAISPPGAGSNERFLERCTSCHLCVAACPTHVLQPALLEYGLAGFLKPHLDYTSAFCNFDCVRCGEVCPDGAIDRLAPVEKQVTQIGVADFHRERCIVITNGTDCAACSEHCPTKAVSTEPYGDNLRVPVLDQDACIGCGACEFACPAAPVKAIRVTGRSKHGRARKRVEEKAVDPASGADFPF